MDDQPRDELGAFRQSNMSKSDIERAATLSLGQCPRRFCWWWRSLSFEWEVPVAEGCTFTEERDAGRLPNYSNTEHPCCRCVPASPADHFEAREPHLIEDGFEPDRFRRVK